MLKVFESGSGKWVQVVDGLSIHYVSDSYSATVFDLMGIRSANEWFADFSIYKETLFAVPMGSNCQPWECHTVRTYLKEQSENAAQ